MTLADQLRLMVDLDDLDLPYCMDAIATCRLQDRAMADHIDRVGIVLYPAADSGCDRETRTPPA